MEIKIKLKIEDVEIELTKDEAKELFDFLKELFGKEVKWETIPIYIEKWKEYYPEWPWWKPSVIYSSPNTCEIIYQVT